MVILLCKSIYIFTWKQSNWFYLATKGYDSLKFKLNLCIQKCALMNSKIYVAEYKYPTKNLQSLTGHYLHTLKVVVLIFVINLFHGKLNMCFIQSKFIFYYSFRLIFEDTNVSGMINYWWRCLSPLRRLRIQY